MKRAIASKVNRTTDLNSINVYSRQPVVVLDNSQDCLETPDQVLYILSRVYIAQIR